MDLVFSDLKNTVCLAEAFVRNNRTIYIRINETATNLMKPIMKCVKERSRYRICFYGSVSEFVIGGCSFGDGPGDCWLVVTRTYLVLDRSGPLGLIIHPSLRAFAKCRGMGIGSPAFDEPPAKMLSQTVMVEAHPTP